MAEKKKKKKDKKKDKPKGFKAVQKSIEKQDFASNRLIREITMLIS